MKRIMIIGQSGSGKSTLAQRIGALLGVSVTHLDREDYLPGWERRNANDSKAARRALYATQMWVCEGSLRTTWVQCVAHAEYVVWIDLPFALRLERVLLRQLRDWGQIKADCPDGCPRRFNLTEIRWLFRSRRKQDRAFTKHFSKAPEGFRLVRLRTPQSIETFFSTLSNISSAPETPGS